MIIKTFSVKGFPKSVEALRKIISMRRPGCLLVAETGDVVCATVGGVRAVCTCEAEVAVAVSRDAERLGERVYTDGGVVGNNVVTGVVVGSSACLNTRPRSVVCRKSPVSARGPGDHSFHL